MLRQLAVSIATFIALSHSQLASAEAWFEVEVYVFERQSQSTEQWPNAPIATNPQSSHRPDFSPCRPSCYSKGICRHTLHACV